jgi:predicted RNA-binding protein YlxR (DUF448 family)
VIDPTGRESGRGAYLCADVACWQTAVKRGGLERALHLTLPAALRETIAAGPEGLAATTTTEPPRAVPGSLDPNTDMNIEGGARGQE